MPAPLTDEWIEEQLELCEAATPGPWMLGCPEEQWPMAKRAVSGPNNVNVILSGPNRWDDPQGLQREEDGIFIIAAREGYILALREIQRLKDVIYGAFEDLRQGESGHAAKTLDDDRELGTKSYYE